MTHTPGEWNIKYQHNVFGGKRLVANCGGYTSNVPSDNADAVNQANARLIAAAPDLLDACEMALGFCKDVYNVGYKDVEIELALLTAIAKAKGGEE